MKKVLLVFTILLFLLSFSELAYAKSDLSISETDISFSKQNPVEGDLVRIYARIFNVGSVDLMGFVAFTDNGKEIQSPQTISIKPNTYDDVFIDWKVDAGTHSIQAKITGVNPPEDNVQNNSTTLKSIVVPTKTSILEKNTNITPQNPNGDLPSSPTQVQEQPNFIKSAVDSLNKKISAEALKYYHLVVGDKVDSAKNETQGTLSRLFSAPQAFVKKALSLLSFSSYIYIGLALLVLVAIYFLFFKKRD